MSNFSTPEFTKSTQIIQALRRSDLLEIALPAQDEVVGVFENSAQLLFSLAHFHPQRCGLIILDPPRATQREQAELWDVDPEGSFMIRRVAGDDPDYRYHLSSTMLAAARLASFAVHDDGWIVACASPGTYMTVRGALEQYLGFNRYRGELVYQTRTGGGNDTSYISIEHESVVVFSGSDAARKLRIKKSDDELGRFNQQDEVGAYYWDTYIRRNARNFYPIECPDGTILERDEHGIPIPWLWRKETFDEKLKIGDVRFRESDGNWRLQYKNRLEKDKETKVIRSLTLSGSPLGDTLASEDGSPEYSGRSLLTQTGTAELRAFSGERPDYVRPSGFFRFMLQCFDHGVGPTVIPFPDRGSAAPAGYVSHSQSDGIASGLLTNNLLKYKDLWEWRVDEIDSAADVDVSAAHPVARISLSDLLSASLELEQVASLVSIMSDSHGEWSTLAVGGLEGLWRPSGKATQFVFVAPLHGLNDDFWLKLKELVDEDVRKVEFWGVSNPDLVERHVRGLAGEGIYHHAPICFLP